MLKMPLSRIQQSMPNYHHYCHSERLNTATGATGTYSEWEELFIRKGRIGKGSLSNTSQTDIDNPWEARHGICVMRQPTPRNRKKVDYPDETSGSRIAAEVRKQSSKLTAEQRRALARRAMIRIYGGEPKEKT